jgi:SAM-dependent methyltransferase
MAGGDFFTSSEHKAAGVITRAEAAETASALAQMLPPSLAPAFGASFIRSSHLYDEFIHRLTLRCFRAAGLEAAAREPGRPEEIAARAGLETQRALTPLDWILRRLAKRGLMEGIAARGQPRRFCLRRALPELDPAAMVEEQRCEDPSWLPSYVLADTVAQDYPAFLRGERRGEEILFSATRLPLWAAFFSNDNGLYAVNNLAGAVAVEEWMPPGPVAALELGAGLGSAAVALLQRLRMAGRWGEIRDYRFTDIVPVFLRRGQQALHTLFPDASFLKFAVLDENRSFSEQGAAPGSLSLVYAVNALHVARDLHFTLSEIFGALVPGGRLVIAECLRPTPDETMYPEFIFNLMETFRTPILHPVYRPHGGFLTPLQWRHAMETAGFVDVRTLPDINRLFDRFPTFYVGAIGATRPA